MADDQADGLVLYDETQSQILHPSYAAERLFARIFPKPKVP